MADFFSTRFGKNVWVTHHARQSMQKRAIDDTTLQQVIEEGTIKRQSEENLWVYKHIEGRTDNLVCAAVVQKATVIVKTVMINWGLEDEA